MATTYTEDDANKTVEIIVDGRVTRAEFDELSKKMEDFIDRHGEIKILEVVRNFDGFDPSMILEGIKFDIKHLKHISHCAVVLEEDGFSSMLVKGFSAVNNAAGRLAPVKVKTFEKGCTSKRSCRGMKLTIQWKSPGACW